MTYRETTADMQARLAEGIRAISDEHRATPVGYWRTALEQVDPEVQPQQAPYCSAQALDLVLDLLDVALGD